jgi:hypothetical protein
MHQRKNRASAGTEDAADRNADERQRVPCIPYKLVRAKNKPAIGSESRRLIDGHWAPASPSTTLAQAFLQALHRKAVRR